MKDYVNLPEPVKHNPITTAVLFLLTMFGMCLFFGVAMLASTGPVSDTTVNAGIAGAVVFVVGTIACWNRKT